MTAPRSYRRPAAPEIGVAQALGGERDGLDDLPIAGAAAQVARDRLEDVGPRGLQIAGQQRVGGEDYARRAVAALQAVGLAEGILQHAELPGTGAQTLD